MESLINYKMVKYHRPCHLILLLLFIFIIVGGSIFPQAPHYLFCWFHNGIVLYKHPFFTSYQFEFSPLIGSIQSQIILGVSLSYIVFTLLQFILWITGSSTPPSHATPSHGSSSHGSKPPTNCGKPPNGGHHHNPTPASPSGGHSGGYYPHPPSTPTPTPSTPSPPTTPIIDPGTPSTPATPIPSPPFTCV